MPAYEQRHERLQLWLDRTYKTASTLMIAANGAFRETTVRQWLKGASEPGAGNLAMLYTLGLDLLWYLFGEGQMFSDTPRGKAFTSSEGVVAEASGPYKSGDDRTPELIARIRDLLKEYD